MGFELSAPVSYPVMYGGKGWFLQVLCPFVQSSDMRQQLATAITGDERGTLMKYSMTKA